MKYVWITLAGVLALAVIAAGVTYYCMRGDSLATADHDADSLLWLRHEFALTPEQLAKIEKLHADYHLACDRHCEAIMEARDQIAALQRSGASAADLEAANAKARQLDAECRESVRTHVHAIAEVMGDAQGQRYLSIVLSNLDRFSHQGPLDLKLDATAHDGHPR